MKFKVVHQDDKGFTWYSEEDNHFFKQSFSWWEKGGYTIPQTKKRNYQRWIYEDVYQYVRLRKEIKKWFRELCILLVV